MYLLLFCTHVQTPPAGNNAINNKICFRVEPNYPETKFELKSKRNVCPTIKVFKTLAEALLKDKTKHVKCSENKAKKCKKCSCVCCSVEPKSVLGRTPTPPYP